MWWGLSPAIDLVAELNTKDANILLIGQCDCRHVLKTLAKKYLHRGSRIKLYVYEPSLDLVARSLLLLTTALEENQGIGKKAQQFLDLYGNTLVRPSTRQYLCEASSRLVNIVTNFNYAQDVLPYVSLESMKYRDRDQLEHIFKYWISAEDFDILNYWDQRLRVMLGTRYDSKLGVFDWDLHMRYIPYGAELVSNQEYVLFREKGISFYQEDSDPCVPNPTLASFPAGAKAPISGYFGELSTGPYPAYGLNCDDKSFFQKYNGLHKYSATDVSFWNVQQMMYEIEQQKPYQPPKGDAQNACFRKTVSEQIKQRKRSFRKTLSEDTYSARAVPDVDVIFIPTSAMKDYPNKQQFKSYFDLVTVPQYFMEKLPGNWHELCKPDCKLVVESSRYMLSMGKDALEKAKKETEEFAKNVGGELVGEFDYKKHDFMRFLIKK